MKKLTARNYLGYAAGDLANNLAFSLQALFLLIYYTNVVGLNPAAIATMFLVVRAWDAFADLVAGRLVDITNSRWGKFRPYLLFSSLPLLLSSIALFSLPNFDSTTAKYIYAYITYALLGFLYSLTNIPYGSLATAMTQDPVERQGSPTKRLRLDGNPRRRWSRPGHFRSSRRPDLPRVPPDRCALPGNCQRASSPPRDSRPGRRRGRRRRCHRTNSGTVTIPYQQPVS
jgi:MFS/sugar transport protein